MIVRTKCFVVRPAAQCRRLSSKGLNLPKTNFPMRANASVREVSMLNDVTDRLYRWQHVQNHRPLFVLHDGPPYANGDLHIGHFMNKCLKDFINRFQLLNGKRVDYKPGWDCHGLPIELKALAAKQGKNKDIRTTARAFASKAIERQRKDFMRWGVMSTFDPESTYRTMDKEYESRQLQVFSKMVEKGLVFHGLKPVFWSYSSKSALAEAEIEYVDDHESPSIYVDFKLVSGNDKIEIDNVNSLVATAWTTTPWSLMSNVALSVNPNIEYSIVDGFPDKVRRLVATDRLNSLISPEDAVIVSKFHGAELENIQYVHPLDTTRKCPIITGDHVSIETGTGIVHTAPAHGQDDAFVWHQHGNKLENCPCPVDMDGRFFRSGNRFGSEELWSSLDGLHVHHGGSDTVIQHLARVGALAKAPQVLKHRYPYDWRTKKPVITLATEQWFINLSSLKTHASKALRDVELVPTSSKARLNSMLEGRNEWCISRQRIWGVPIPALFERNNHSNVWLDKYLVNAFAEYVKQYGTDWWFDKAHNVEELVSSRANELREEDGLGPRELSLETSSWRRGMDTLDVWFDSGCSWFASKCDLVDGRADVYLEGSDQHRGWFQSSLLTKVASADNNDDIVAPFKKLVTHGFIKDEADSKMSKSKGNTVAPNDVVNGKGSIFGKEPPYGVDVVRFWVASTDYTRDAPFGPRTIKEASDGVRKVRNVLRFVLSNLYDFDLSEYTKREGLTATTGLDDYMLDLSYRYTSSVKHSYETFNYRSVYVELLKYVSEVSSVYAPSVKDRLYCEDKDSETRRICQGVLWEILKIGTLTAAPILCFTAQDIYNYTRKEVGSFGSGDEFSPFQCEFPTCPASWKLDDAESGNWKVRLRIRDVANKMIATLNEQGVVQVSEQLKVYIKCLRPDEVSYVVNQQKKEEDLLTNLLLVSSCSFSTPPSEADLLLSSNDDEFEIIVTRTNKLICDRCRRYTRNDNTSSLCTRCQQIPPI